MYRSLLVVVALSTVTGCAFLQPDAKPTAPGTKTAKVEHPGKAAVALFDAPASAPAAPAPAAEKPAEKPAVVASNDHPAAKSEGTSKSRLMMPVKLDNPPKESSTRGGAKGKRR